MTSTTTEATGGTRLHQVNAVLQGFKPAARRELTDAYQRVQRAPLLSGISRDYAPLIDGDEQLPPESTYVQTLVEDPSRSGVDVLSLVGAALSRLLDLQLIQDASNATASADLVVEGDTLLRDVPLTYLLFLEKQLGDVRTFLQALPVLDAAERWTFDPQRRCHVSEAAKSLRMRKVRRNHVLYEATKEHPAQVESYAEDEPRGTWTTYKLSGAMPAERARLLRRRVDVLLEAVKKAREEANSTFVVDRRGAGEAVFGYLFAR